MINKSLKENTTNIDIYKIADLVNYLSEFNSWEQLSYQELFDISIVLGLDVSGKIYYGIPRDQLLKQVEQSFNHFIYETKGLL